MKHSESSWLFRYFSGLASPEEAMRVENWRSESADNSEFFDELWQLWFKGSSYESVDVMEAYDAFIQKTQNKKAKTVLWKWIPYAAILLVCLSIGVYQFTSRDTPKAQTYTYNEYNSQFELLDGVAVQLFATASLQKQDAATFSLQVEKEGKAFFDFGTTHPDFLLMLPSGLQLKDIGTRFTVELKEGLEIIHVHSGTVEVWNEQFKTEIHAQEVFTFDIAKRNYIKREYLISFEWKDRTLQSICAELSKAFQVDVRLADVALAEKMLSLTGENLSLSAIMDIISGTLNVQYNFTKDEIVIEDL
jgi:transmembrane sensor